MSSPIPAIQNQYLTYRLDSEVFAFDIARVREVMDFTTLTKVPKTPDYLRGVLNLRGKVVPVMDLKLKFGMARTEKNVDTSIIITEVDVDGETTDLGILADAVQEVIELDPGQIEPAPRIGSGIRSDVIKGMGKHNGSFIMVLDIDRIVSAQEISLPQKGYDVAGMTDAA